MTNSFVAVSRATAILVAATLLPHAAIAQQRTGGEGQRAPTSLQYDCQNEPVAVEIPGDRLDAALAQLRIATRCPISGTELARGKRSRPLVGTMTPAAALRTMLQGTGLRAKTIKGGFEVVRRRR